MDLNMDFNEINDTISELKVKNQILENDLYFANKCLNVLIEFKNVFNRLIDRKSEKGLLNLEEEDIQELQQLNEKYDKIIDEKEIKSEVNEENKEFFISQNTDSLNALIVEQISTNNHLTESTQKTANQPVIREKSLVSNEITLHNNGLAYTPPLTVVPITQEMLSSENSFCLNQLILSTNQSLNKNSTNLTQIQSNISLQNTGNWIKVVRPIDSTSALQFRVNQPKISLQSIGQQSTVPSIPNLVVWRSLSSDQLSNQIIKIPNNGWAKEKGISDEMSNKIENLIKDNESLENSKVIFKCLIDCCNKTFEVKELVECHQKECHNTVTALDYYKISWKCGHPSCGINFSKEFDLKVHIISKHLNKETQKKRSPEDKSTEEPPKRNNILKDVLKEICPDFLILCIIDDCNDAFETKELLESHQKESHNIKTDFGHYKYLYYEVSDEANSNSREIVPKKNSRTDTNESKSTPKRKPISRKMKNLIKGNKSAETSKMKFKCIIDECNRIYKTKGLLECHQKESHNTETDCKYISNDNSEDSYEANTNMSEEVPTESSSQQSINIDTILKDNKNMKSAKKVMKCVINECNKIFQTKDLLKSHQMESHKTITQTKYYQFYWNCGHPSCPNKLYTRTFDLKQHILSIHLEGRHFKCDFPDCGKSYKTARYLRAHQLSHSRAKSFKCKFEGCDYTTKYKQSMKNHEYTHSDYKPFVCRHCEKRTRTKHCLIMHLKVHHTKEKPQVCPVEGCAKLIKSYNLEKHITEHSMENVSCDYPQCDYECKLKANMMKHIQYVHTTERNFVCECGKAFKSSGDLLVHVRIHTNERYFKCNFKDCEKSFKTATHLKAHEKYFHSQLKPYDCKQCKKQFKSKSSFHIHLKTHEESSGVTKIRPQILCPIEGCGKSVKYLSAHLYEVHSKKNLSCDLPGCQYKCKTKQALKAHKSNVHSSVRNYSCHWPECGKAFKTSGNLSTHMKSHTNDRPFSCDWPQCQYRGMTSTNLKEHLRTHTKEKPFACEWPGCDYRCTVDRNLKNHWKVHQKD